MRRIAIRTARTSLVWTVIVLLSIDSGIVFGAMARVRAQRHGHPSNPKAVYGAEQKDKDDEGAVQKGGAAKGESAWQKGVGEDKAVEVEKPAVEKPAEVEKTAEPAKPAEVEKPAEQAKPVEMEKPAVEKPVEAEKPAEPAKPAVENPPVEKPVEPVKPAEPAKPAVEKPVPVEKPVVPAEPAMPLPAVPAEKPATEIAPPKIETAPAEKPTVPSQPLEDLFGTPDSGAKPPAAEESSAKPAGPELTPPAPASEANPAAKAKDALDGLFDTPPQPAKPATAPAPASAPTPTPAPAKPASARLNSDSLNDLFGDAPMERVKPANSFKHSTPVAPASPAATNPSAAKRDPFSYAPPAGAEESAVRTWTDNTGKYTVRARLVQILDGKVRLLKDNGRTCTVAMSRLSSDDVTYVQFTAATRMGDASRQLAHAGL